MDKPQFKIKHIGINTQSDATAQELVLQICWLFDITPNNETESHIFAGDLFEVMKNEKIGKCGHIALLTDDMEGAIRHFAAKGISIREDTIRRDTGGHISFVYLDLEIGGFAIHLTI